MFRSGFVAIIGRPNVGKSTLLNTLIGEKMAITSDKPQTTRNQIRGILTGDNYQAIFLDTPGIHKPRHRLGKKMVDVAVRTLQDVDMIFFLVDAAAGAGTGDEYIVRMLENVGTPVVLVVNKADAAGDQKVGQMMDHFQRLYPFYAIAAVSALKGTAVEKLRALVAENLPEGPMYYPADMVTDQPERFIAAELIREKILLLTREEVPHAVAVEVQSFAQRKEKNLLDIQANIYVERESQKGIIIGKNGAMLREIGRLSREDIESLLGCAVYLELWVKVKPDWRNKEGTWQHLGLDLG